MFDGLGRQSREGEKMKKILAMILVLAMTLALCACGSSGTQNTQTETTAAAAASSGKTILNVWSFTDEVPNMWNKFFELYPEYAEKYEVNSTIIATTDGLYQPALDAALSSGGADAPDMYCAESAFILKYSQGDAANYAAAYEDLGIDTSKIKSSEIAQYSVDIGTRPSDGKVVGLGYQATGGAFIYRRSVAKDAFGTDDPKQIEEIIGAGSGNWDKFFEAAETLKGKGYAIVSGDGDIWHPIENSADSGWVVDGKLNIDPKREAFLDISKTLYDNEYMNDTKDWQEAWFADMKGEGEKEVFGFFGPAWLINYTIAPNCGGEKVGEGTYGDWAVCTSPIGFFWGGTWLLANKDTPNADIIGKFIEWVTLDDSETALQTYWANGTLNGEGGTKDSVASGTVMSKANGEMEFLGGQNMFDAFVPANQYANGKTLTQYDETINSYWRDAVRQYAHGEVSREDAIKSFKQNISDNLAVTVE